MTQIFSFPVYFYFLIEWIASSVCISCTPFPRKEKLIGTVGYWQYEEFLSEDFSSQVTPRDHFPLYRTPFQPVMANLAWANGESMPTSG